MNHKLLPLVAAFLILVVALGSTPLTYALAPVFGPKLEVWTIPQDDQKREKGIIILGLGPGQGKGTDLMSQHKLLITYNGAPLTWRLGEDVGVTVACNWVEKDKVNVIPDPKTGLGQQFLTENLMTKLVDVSIDFVCKPRWKPIGNGWVESVGVLDVYFVGNSAIPNWIADTILVVTAYITVGRSIAFGSDIQDICVLGWSLNTAEEPVSFTKPDGSQHYIFPNALGNYVSCEDAALYQRDVLGVKLETGQDYYDLEDQLGLGA